MKYSTGNGQKPFHFIKSIDYKYLIMAYNSRFIMVCDFNAKNTY